MSRADRVAEQLLRELSELIREIKDPRVQAATLVTLTNVRVSEDLGVARVHVSIIAEDRLAAMKGIGKASKFLHGQLVRRLRAKKIPELRFLLDDTEKRAGHIDDILREIHGEEGSGADLADSETDLETDPETEEASEPPEPAEDETS